MFTPKIFLFVFRLGIAITITIWASPVLSQGREAVKDASTIRIGKINAEVAKLGRLQRIVNASRISGFEQHESGLRVGQPYLGTGQLPATSLTPEAFKSILAKLPTAATTGVAKHESLSTNRVRRADPAVAVIRRDSPGWSDASAQSEREGLTAIQRDAVVAELNPDVIENLTEAINTSPAPNRTQVSMSGQNDPGIAASSQFLTVVGYNRIAFYDKATLNLLQPKPGGTGFKNVIGAMEFFRPLWDPANTDNVNTHLNLPPNLPCDPGLEPGPNPDETRYCLDDYYDLRVAWDRERGRFWIVGLARNSQARGSGKSLEVLQGRRSVVVTAVSASSDPRDGFYLYWWPAPIEMGFCNNTTATLCEGAVEYRPGDAGDYPTLAVTEDYLMVGIGVANVIDAKNKKNSSRYAVMHVYRATPLAQGLASGCEDPCGWSYWNIPDFNGNPLKHVIYPARQTDGAPVSKSFFTRTTGDKLLFYAIDEPRSDRKYPLLYSAHTVLDRTRPSGSADAQNNVNDAPLPGTSDTMKLENLGAHVISAFYRTGMVYSVMQDCMSWTAAQSECATSIRLVRANVGHLLQAGPNVTSGDAGALATPSYKELSNSAGSYYLDRTFGLRGPGDSDDAIVYYGNPAVAVNNRGDMGIVYMRAGSDTYPEARYSLFRYDGNDILKSRLLKKGDRNLTGNYDTGGAELDPDGETFWFVHAYGDAGKKSSRFIIAEVKP